MVIGTVLVLLSWMLGLLLMAGLGRLLAGLLAKDAPRDERWRASLWWGLVTFTAMAMAINLILPLHSRGALGLAALVIALLMAAGLMFYHPSPVRFPRPSAGVIAVLAALGLAVVYLAFKALGPATNYDTGLYHLSAIKYASDFSAIPGLATLHAPLGYANAQFPLAALLGNGPWGGEGFRLLNGLVLVVATSDVVSRLLNRRWSWGTYVLLLGLSAALVPLIALADALVTSPTSDTSVLIITVVASAYLADAIIERRGLLLQGSVVIALSGLLVVLRPTMGVYALASVVVVAALWFRRHPRRGVWSAGAAGVGVLLVLSTLTILRDRLLSGWILYPLSVLPLDVPWRADDPTWLRDATLAAARDPGAADHYVVAHSWSWIPIWLTRLPQQWEFWFLVVGLVATLAVTLMAQRRVGDIWNSRRLWLALAPSMIAVVAWFALSPPSFRFIWGPLFCLLVVPLALSITRLDLTRTAHESSQVLSLRSAVVGGATLCILLVTLVSVIWRNQATAYTEERTWSLGPLSVPFSTAPIPLPPVEERSTAGGLTVITPLPGSDQCWDNYPLCTVDPPTDLALRGDTIGDGFVRE